MTNRDNLPDNLTVCFQYNDIMALDEIVEAMERIHPENKWTLERAVHLAVGTLWRELTSTEDITVGEFLSLQLDYPVEL